MLVLLSPCDRTSNPSSMVQIDDEEFMFYRNRGDHFKTGVHNFQGTTTQVKDFLIHCKYSSSNLNLLAFHYFLEIVKISFDSVSWLFVFLCFEVSVRI